MTPNLKTTLQQLKKWIRLAESEHLEFKQAGRQFDSEKLTRYCVALANEGGGKLILGVTDKLPRRVAGTVAFPDVGKTQAQLLDGFTWGSMWKRSFIRTAELSWYMFPPGLLEDP